MSSVKIAVLPFQFSDADERMQLLFKGFTEDLITNFSKFIGISVISYFSTQQIRDISQQSEIDRLGADFIVVGSMRHKPGNIVRVSVHLVKADDRSLIFADQFDKSLESIAEAQDLIIQQLVHVLQEKISFNVLSHSYAKKNVELAAYENYLLGMSTLRKGSKDDDIKARKYFEAALKVDPNYSPAYTGISLSYFNYWSCILWSRWDQSMRGAFKYALKAIEIDPNDYVALGVLGRIYIYKGEPELAEHNLRKSLRMNSNDASHLLRVSFSLVFLGYANEALALYHKAMEINPLHSELYYAYGSSYYLQSGDFEKSIALSKKTSIRSWTDFPAWVAAAYLQAKNYPKVWECWNIYLELFEQATQTHGDNKDEEAVNWMFVISPFVVDNYLQDLADFIRSEKNIPKPELTSEKAPRVHGGPSLHFNGNVWEFAFRGESVLLKDMKGLHDIHRLLGAPEEEFHCLDLMNAGIDESVSEKATDSRSKTEYRNRIRELRGEIDDAREFNDLSSLERLQEEYEHLLEHLSGSLGLGGKSRKIGSTIEKSRSAITWRIRNAIKKIGASHPELGDHLSKSIRTGTYCSYKPAGKISWNL